MTEMRGGRAALDAVCSAATEKEKHGEFGLALRK